MQQYDYYRLNTENPVRDVLQKLGIKVRGSSFPCPICGDGAKSESGSIFLDRKAGYERVHCHGKCDKSYDSIDLAKWFVGGDSVSDAVAWLTGEKPAPNGHGRPPNGHAKRREPPKLDFAPFPPDKLALFQAGALTPSLIGRGGKLFKATPAAIYRYGDGKSVRMLVLRVIKTDGGKIFFPVRWSPTRGFVATSWQEGEEFLFYRQQDLAAYPDKTVLVVEGEKTCDLLRGPPAITEEYVTITWAGGSGTAKYQPWELLKGRRILFWPDADLPDIAKGHVLGKSEIAMRAAAKVANAAVMQIVVPPEDWGHRLKPDGTPIKGYAADDLLQEGMPAHEVRALMESLADTIEDEETEEKPPPPEPDPPPVNDDGSKPRWVEKPITPPGGGITWVLDTRDENNIWVQLTELAPPKGYRGRFSRDVFTQEVLLDGKVLDEGHGPHVISHEIALTRILRSVTRRESPRQDRRLRSMNPVNPLADELRALAWDGTHRYLLDYAGVPVPEGSWARVAGWRWLLGLVRRILEPGCQHDGVLVLEGPQGSRKTSFFRTVGTILGRDLFVEVEKLSRDPDTLMILQGKAVVELAEMSATRRDVNATKSMLSTESDKYRRPYGRKPEDVKRTCVFGGTTNDRKYLRDPTGNRRYWIVRVAAPMRLDALKNDLPQLLAQAVHYLTNHHPVFSQNWLTLDEEKMQESVAKERLIDWPQFDRLDFELDKLPPGDLIERHEVWTKLGYTSAPPSNSDLSQQLTILMEERGWPYKQHARYTGLQRHNRWSWKKPDVTDS